MYPYAISMLVYIDGYYGVTITTTDVIDIADTCIEMHQKKCTLISMNYTYQHNVHINFTDVHFSIFGLCKKLK